MNKRPHFHKPIIYYRGFRGFTSGVCQFSLNFYIFYSFKKHNTFLGTKGFGNAGSPAHSAVSMVCFQTASHAVVKTSFMKWNDATLHICQLSMQWPYSFQARIVAPVAHFTSCLFLALLLICNVAVRSVCSQQTNIKLRFKSHRWYEHRYEEIAPILGFKVFGPLNF